MQSSLFVLRVGLHCRVFVILLKQARVNIFFKRYFETTEPITDERNELRKSIFSAINAEVVNYYKIIFAITDKEHMYI